MTEINKTKISLRIAVTSPSYLQNTQFIAFASEKDVLYSTRYDLDENILDLKLGVLSLDVNKIEYDIELVSLLPHHPMYREVTIFDYRQVDKIALVMIVNNTFPETFREAMSHMGTYRAYGTFPYVFAVTHFQESQGRWDFSEWWKRQPNSIEIPILQYDPTDKKSVAKVLMALCEEILKDDNQKQDMLE